MKSRVNFFIMETLPDQVITEILNYFSLKERAQYRLICKKFSELDLASQDSLCIHRDTYPLNLTWTLTSKSERGKLVGHQNSTDFLNKKFYKLNCSPLKKIRKLYLTCNSALNVLQISANKLGYFKGLEELEIFDGQFDENVKWSFKKLKVLSLNRCKFNCVVELDCPSLESFVCWTEIKNLKFNHPSSLKYLELFDFDASIARFKRVETLAFLCFSSIDLEICARELTKLKELHLNVANYRHLDLEELNGLVASLERGHLKVHLTWFKLAKCAQSKRVLVDEGNSAIALGNYENLENNLRYRFEVNFSALTRAFNSCFPTDFFRKFASISHVEIDEPADDTLLFGFLMNCNQLKGLQVNELFIDQFPYHLLGLLSTLEELKLSKSNLFISNYEFLGDLRSLKSLHLSLLGQNIEFPLLFDFVWNALLRCKSLRKLSIFKNNKFVDKFICIKLVHILTQESIEDCFLVYNNAQVEHLFFENLNKLLVHLIKKELPALLNNKD